jgi:WD40 repeat protein
VAFAPDGNTVLGLLNGLLTLWEPATGKELGKFKHEGEIHYLGFSSEGTRLLTSGTQLTLWSWPEGKPLRSLALAKSGRVAIAPDGKQAVVVADVMELWSLPALEMLRKLPTGTTCSPVFSPDSKRLLVGYDNGTLGLWDCETGEKVRTFVPKGVPGRINAVSFFDGGRQALSAGDHQRLIVWDVATGKQVREFEYVPAR